MPEPVKLASGVIVGAASVGSGEKAAKARLLTPAMPTRLAKATNVV